MADVRIPYGPRRSELAAEVAKHNKGKPRASRIDPDQPRDALLAALGKSVKPVTMEAG